MSEELKVKWDKIYSEKTVGEHHASDVLTRNKHLLPMNGSSLDVAAGMGANAIYLAERGFDALAVDISQVAVDRINAYGKEKNISLSARVMNLEKDTLGAELFDVITVAHYLERKIAPMLINALKPNGLLFYQTFTKEKTEGATTPSNPDFLLKENELLQLFSPLQLVYYREEGLLGDWSQGIRNEALFVGRKFL
ncbi:MAG: class I SAM-dependent methyltransferase [Gammaproteobacteria bacterium]|nr:class I SAM-dependent methyltransferase [Gammaproteobacteria bacterium]